MALVKRRVANPVQPILALVNGPRRKRKKNMAATRKRSSTRRSTTRRANKRRKSTSVARRTSRHALHARANPVKRRRTRRQNPVHHRRRRHGRRNPVGAGVFGEAINLSISGFAVTIAAPMVNRLIGGLIPLGQFQQPLIFAGTGLGLGWLAGFAPFTRKFQRPLVVMGLALGATALFTPWVRRLFSGVGINGGVGMSGYRNRHMSGIAAVTGIPPNVMSLPAPATPAAAGGMKGIGVWGNRGY